MKKNISVNIFGTIYSIDEDAYELLQKYNENMRSYYSRREGGEEIADDVEHRVAELLSELRSQGVMAITIEHVTEIINRIGDPQQMDEEEEQFSSSNAESAKNETTSSFTGNTGNTNNGQTGSTPPPPPFNDGPSDKKLFRDPEDRILGGVLSGLSHYFGIKETLLLRIITVLLGLISLSTIAILYVIAWILIPEATTPEDRLRMYGKPVNAKSLNEELLRGVHSASNFVNNPQNQDKARGCLSAILKFIVICFAIFVCFILACILLAIIAAVTGIGIATIVTPSAIGISEFDSFSTMLSMLPTWLIILSTVSGLLLVGLPLYAIIRAVFADNKRPLASSVKTGLIILWLASIATLIGSGISIMKIGHNQFNQLEKEKNTHNGVYLRSDGWSLLKRWDVAELQGVSPGISHWGKTHNGEYENYIHLEVKENPNDMKYDLRQSRTLRPGKYMIEGYINADGEGNALYVIIPGSNQEVTVDIPKHIDNGNIVDTDTIDDDNDSSVEIDSRDNGLRQWTHVEKQFEITQEGTVVYGITNNPAYTLSPWNSREVSVSGIYLKKIED